MLIDRLISELELSTSITSDADDISQARLINRQVLGIPPSDSLLIIINDCDPKMRVLVGHDSGRWSTYLSLSPVNQIDGKMNNFRRE